MRHLKEPAVVSATWPNERHEMGASVELERDYGVKKTVTAPSYHLSVLHSV